jgi:hypothetical protein
MISIATWDFLQGLEEAHRINSDEEVYRRAEDAGRLASRRLCALHDSLISGRALKRRGAGACLSGQPLSLSYGL